MIYKENKFNEEKWSKLLGICIMDEDGWRNDNTSLEKKITLDDYLTRMSYSTICVDTNINLLDYTLFLSNNLIIYLLKYGKRLNFSYINSRHYNFHGRIDNHTFKVELLDLNDIINIITVYINGCPKNINNLEHLLNILENAKTNKKEKKNEK